MNKENSIPKLEGKENLDSTFTTRHAYDIDVFDIYNELKKKYPNDGNVKISNEMDNSTFFEMQEDVFVKSLIDQGIDLSKEQAVRGYVVPSSFYSYMSLLAWKILLISPYKIGELLSYQSKRYLGNSIASKDNFLGLVEFPVFQFVEALFKANSFQNENIRLDKIMGWVNKNRIFEKSNTEPDKQKHNRPKESLPPHQIETLKEWVLFDYISIFLNVEKELYDRGYINEEYHWRKYKKNLLELVTLLHWYKYFKPIINGRKKKGFHYRQFIAERYGFDRIGLTETYKKYKPTNQLAENSFLWIKKPS